MFLPPLLVFSSTAALAGVFTSKHLAYNLYEKLIKRLF
jgi:hypothetical protein